MVIYRGILLISNFRRCDNASVKAFEMKEASNNYLPIRTNDLIVNPTNLENPDSKTQVKAGEFYIETCRGEDASIASLQGIKKLYQLDDLMLGYIVP